MPKKCTFNDEQIEELKQARKKNKDKNVDRRLSALLMISSQTSHKEVAKQTGYSEQHITVLSAKYRKHGIHAIIDNHYKGNRRSLSYAEEEELLETFKEAALSGQVVEINEILKAYEEKIGHSLEKSHGQIYFVLKRHGWRKVMPRSQHPNKATPEAIEASKKLTIPSEPRWEIIP
jgi:transposase